MIALTVFLTLGTLVASDPQIIYREVDYPVLFQKYKEDYNKTYSSQEEAKRFQIFKNNMLLINKLNAGSQIATFGITKYADMTREEFRLAKTSAKSTAKQINYVYDCDEEIIFNGDVPPSLDWRKKGLISRIKDQRDCRAGWAFSTTGILESTKGVNDKLTLFSEQQLIDCVKHNDGCNGGDVETALKYLINNVEGPMTEEDYPYKGNYGSCVFNASSVKDKATECLSHYTETVEDLSNALYQCGPLAMSIAAENLYYYRSGILSQEECPATDLNHSVLLIGYGTENNASYWIAKNSWGLDFGENGYFRLLRKIGENPCNMFGDLMYTVSVTHVV